jgi:hypothetical protein
VRSCRPVPAPSPLASARRVAVAVLVVGLLIAAGGVVLVLVFDTFAGFAAVAVGVFVALGAERRRSYIDLLERRGGRYATASMLSAGSWLPFRSGSGGPTLGGQGDMLGGGGGDGGGD